ncbi:sigma-70 family RNA polymerase sigma factor [Rubripirellula sp.]|jgi:RNA polymerase sigma-70 factor (subfamily 1)|nr:sigma-70 family RNA polymerase sigma factor [Rubripirellula sp.]
MRDDHATDLEEYREYLGLLGRLQLDDMLAGKVDVSGVVQMTPLEAGQGGWGQLAENERAAWLRRIFANNLLDEIRKFRTQARDVDREFSIHQVEQSASSVHQWWAAQQSSPSQRAIREEQELRLVKAMSCLPAEQCEAIELRHLQGLQLDDIARRMNRSKGAVAALIYRGTTRLRELLSKEGREEC